jgi:hypothetical protein
MNPDASPSASGPFGDLEHIKDGVSLFVGGILKSMKDYYDNKLYLRDPTNLFTNQRSACHTIDYCLLMRQGWNRPIPCGAAGAGSVGVLDYIFQRFMTYCF